MITWTNIFNRIKTVLLGVSSFLLLPSTILLSSCSDFLEIEPLNEIVLENFWNEKADVR